MQAAGPGARAKVYGAHPGNQLGHVFNVVNQGGVIRYVDGQTGRGASFLPYVSLKLRRVW